MRLGFFLSVLRIMGLGLRLLLSLFVSGTLGVDAFGRFSLLLAVSALVPTLVLMGLHHKVNRAVVGRSPMVMATWLRDRIVLDASIGGTLAGVALAGFLVFVPFELSGPALASFLAICLLESILADSQVYLLCCKRPVLANLILFNRTALWVPAYICAAWFFGWQSLDPILFFWLGGCVISVATLVIGLWHWPWGSVMRIRPAYRWQFKDFRITSGLWLSDVSAAVIPFMERSLLFIILGPTATGVYALFWTLANGIQQVVVTAVIQPAIPVMVGLVREDASGKLLFTLVWRKSREVVAAVAGFGSIIVFIGYFALPFLGGQELRENFRVLPLLVIGIAVGCVAETLRVALYALRRDGDLILSNVGALVLNVALLVAAAVAFGLTAVAVVPLLVATSVSIFRWRRALRGAHNEAIIVGETGS